MNLYFNSEEDTMKNLIFLKQYIDHPTHTFEEKYLFTKHIKEFYKLCMFFSYKIIIDRTLDIISDLFTHQKIQ